MVLRSDHYDHPMRFERAMDLLIYRVVNDFKNEGKYNFEVRTNAKLLNPYSGKQNVHINVKNKKKPDGETALSRPDVEIEDPENGLWIIIDAKNYSSSVKVPSKEELNKDVKCRWKRKGNYSPTVGLMICSLNQLIS